MKTYIYIILFFFPVLCYAEKTNPNGEISFSGVVIDSVTGLPVPSATVFFPGEKISLESSEDGTFKTILPCGTHKIKITNPGYDKYNAKISINDSIRTNMVFLIRPKIFQLDSVVVKSRKTGNKASFFYDKTDILSGNELQKNTSISLGETMKTQNGIALRSMGPAPSRPVVRGLSGDRVVIGQNGITTYDLSSTSPDHAVTLESFTIDKIELIKGPKILLYSPVTIGGMIDTKKKSIPDKKGGSISGSTGFYAETARPGGIAGATLTVPYGNYSFYGETTLKKTGEESTPEGILDNTDLKNKTFVFGASKFFKKGYTGFSIDQFISIYGIPGGFIGGHPKGVDIDMMRRSVRMTSSFTTGFKFLRSIDTDIDRTYYTHTEYESGGNVGAEFLQKNYTVKSVFTFDTFNGKKNTTLSVDYKYRNLKMGGYVFTAPTKSYSYSTAVIHERKFKKTEIQTGARYDHVLYNPNPDKSDSNIGYIDRRSFDTFSLSFAALYPFNDNFNTGITLSRSARVPTIEELYNEGPHLAAYSYETGNPALKDERGTGIEIFGNLTLKRTTLQITGYLNKIDSFIAFRNTGEINWQQILPIYRAESVDALMSGFETYFEFDISKTINFSVKSQYTYGKNITDNLPLPMIPPLRVIVNISGEKDSFGYGLESESACKQNRVDVYEHETSGYSIFRPYIQKTFFSEKMVNRIVFSIDNVFDKEYRNHLSRIKSIMPDTGRNFKLNYKVYF